MFLCSVGKDLQKVLAVCLVLAQICKGYWRFAWFWHRFAEGTGGLLGFGKDLQRVVAVCLVLVGLKISKGLKFAEGPSGMPGLKLRGS